MVRRLIDISEYLWRKVSILAAKEGKSKKDVVVEALSKHLKEKGECEDEEERE